GGTDLQSVGFNHSPTCAKPQTRRPNLPANSTFCATQTNKFQQALHRRTLEGGYRSTQLESSLWKLLLENLYAATTLAQNVLRPEPIPGADGGI
ncbi:MAG TPA: hypothetical protein VE843_01870, partial [Ktedonobacteraceae bacterium]|nr:hypothetical protein [Ktedonobacteraceae bacterium]